MRAASATALPEPVRQASVIELALAVRSDDERPLLDDLIAGLRQAAVTYARTQA